MKLLELFDSPSVPYGIKTHKSHDGKIISHEISFYINKVAFDVDLDIIFDSEAVKREFYGELPLNPNDMVPLLMVQFSKDHQWGRDESRKDVAYKVLSNVFNLVEKYIKKYEIKVLAYEPATPMHAKIYKRVLASKGYEIYGTFADSIVVVEV